MPRWPTGRRRFQMYSLNLTELENAYIKRFADEDKVPGSEWCRRLVLVAIRERIAQARQAKAS